jgi:hypothetical protein
MDFVRHRDNHVKLFHYEKSFTWVFLFLVFLPAFIGSFLPFLEAEIFPVGYLSV